MQNAAFFRVDLLSNRLHIINKLTYVWVIFRVHLYEYMNSILATIMTLVYIHFTNYQIKFLPHNCVQQKSAH